MPLVAAPQQCRTTWSGIIHCEDIFYVSQSGLCYVTRGSRQTFLYLSKVTLIQSVSQQRESQECYGHTRLKCKLKTTVMTPIGKAGGSFEIALT